MKLRPIAAIAAALILTGGTAVFAQSAAPHEETSSKKPMQIKLLQLNASGETGTATLMDSEKGLVVKLVETGAAEGSEQPAHIHKGTCDKLDPKPAYPLSTVKNGTSETVLKDLTIADLQKGTFAINTHKSTTDIPTYVSCGNIPAKK